MQLEDINKKLRGNVIAKVLLNKFSLPHDGDIRSLDVSDPLYLPFYYYLGEIIKPENILELCFGVGLCSGSFLASCKSVNKFIAFQEQFSEYYPQNIGKHNIKRVYRNKFYLHYGNLLDEVFLAHLDKFKPNLIFIREKNKDAMSRFLDFSWNILDYDNMLCVDYTNYSDDHKKLLDVFKKVRNRDSLKFNTRYGTEIIVK